MMDKRHFHAKLLPRSHRERKSGKYAGETDDQFASLGDFLDSPRWKISLQELSCRCNQNFALYPVKQKIED